MSRKSILAVGAHPDDVEQGMGATMAKHRSIGDHTCMIICTLGLGGSCGDLRLREEEARNAARILGTDLLVLDYPVLKLNKPTKDFEQILKKTLEDIHPDRIYTHSPNDYHQVHNTVARCVTTVSAKVKQLVYFEDISSTTPDFRPNAYVDVTDFMEAKLASLQEHRTQSSKYYLQHNVLKSLAYARYVMSKIGNRPNGMAEAFSIQRFIIGNSD